MKAEYINSFYGATEEVFKLMLNLEVKRGDLEIIEGFSKSKDANVTLGVTGELKGNVQFSFSKDMTLEMVKIMAGMEMEEIDVFVSSALGEVANIISGNAVTRLASHDYKCDITPPQITVGEHQSISMANKKALHIPVLTDIGEFGIDVFLPE
ncbi:MAG: chemotaxis protein CheX [Tissierella sp.]|uniref:chemotaxis protein CheX n=1 Tax=Tissierella sp. TaxID=41274 RepID=UPI003F95C7A8